MIPDPEDAAFLKTLRVLYVEDDPEVRRHTSRALEHRVGSLAIAASGEEGLAAFQAHRPDLVITDIQMPGMDGLTLAGHIRQASARIPILVTTAFGQVDFLLRAIELGIHRYLIKPVDGDHLDRALLACARSLRAEAALRELRSREQRAAFAQQEEAMSILAAGMAQDYNQLLQSILSAISQVRECMDQPHQALGILAHIERSATRAKDLGRNLMAYARGEVSPSTETSLPRFLEECFEGLPVPEGIQVDLDLPPDLPTAAFDELRLAEVVQHLARNAFEAMPGGGSLRVVARPEQIAAAEALILEPGPYLRVTFEDTGCGIPSDDLPLVFNPYFTTRKSEGTRRRGLGLALCRAILRAHGGALRAASTPGEGTAMSFYLPVHPADRIP